MADEQKPDHAFARSRSNAGLGVTPRIEAHLRQLSPHMMQREGVVLLREAHVEIERLRRAIQQTLDENGHLADGDNCTLIMLKLALMPNV